MRILFVCLGNICRSPLAQGILDDKARERGLNWEIDSAGTGYWHIGEGPDPRSIKVARKNGLDISNQRARQFSRDDFTEFDFILTADDTVHQEVLQFASAAGDRDKVRKMVTFLNGSYHQEIPDPWYGGQRGFDAVFALLEEMCDNILSELAPGSGS